MTTVNDIINLIHYRHRLPEWIFIPELRNSTGYVQNVRSIDAVAINTWPSTNFRSVGYEIKVSRSDFLSELRAPEKRKWSEEHFNETYFVCVPDICKVDEIPESWGLLLMTKKGDMLRQKKAALYREANDLPYYTMISILRRMAETLANYKYNIYSFEGQIMSREELSEIVNRNVDSKRKELKKLYNELLDKRNEVNELRNNLVSPLSELKSICGEYRWDLVETATVESVREWASKVEGNLLKRKLGINIHTMTSVRDKLTDIINRINELS